jgi:hypothetical protein
LQQGIRRRRTCSATWTSCDAKCRRRRT